MFTLTKTEQKIVAFLVAVLVIGTAVRTWRARTADPVPASMKTAAAP
jgi:hypothetical protein